MYGRLPDESLIFYRNQKPLATWPISLAIGLSYYGVTGEAGTVSA